MKFLYVVLLTLILTAWVTSAATYNFYFNNTEQGDHSSAQPQLNVNGGKVTKTGEDGEEEEVENQLPFGPPQPEAPAPAPVAESAPAQSEARVSDYDYDSQRPKKWRFLFGALTYSRSYDTVYPQYDSQADPYVFSSLKTNTGGAVSLAYFPSESFGLNFFGGAYFPSQSFTEGILGADLEFVPLRVNALGVRNFFQMGLLLGGSNMKRARGNWATIHAGLRLTFELGKDWLVNIAGRGNMGFIQANAGFGVRI